MTCSRIVFLTLGSERVPQSLSLEDGSDDVELELPVCGALVRAPAGWVLLETGMAGESGTLVRELGRCGVRVQDLALAALSHFHVDHGGGLELLRDAGVPVHVQRRELAFARTPAARDQDYVGVPDGVDWVEHDGDGPIAEGIDAVFTPGHTPGHMSYRVRLAHRAYLLAIDAIDLQEGIDRDVPIGSSADPADAPKRRRSHDRLVALARAEGAELVAGHCPVTWPTRPGPPDGVG